MPKPGCLDASLACALAQAVHKGIWIDPEKLRLCKYPVLHLTWDLSWDRDFHAKTNSSWDHYNSSWDLKSHAEFHANPILAWNLKIVVEFVVGFENRRGICRGK